jgi:hypothetical protein
MSEAPGGEVLVYQAPDGAAGWMCVWSGTRSGSGRSR